MKVLEHSLDEFIAKFGNYLNHSDADPNTMVSENDMTAINSRVRTIRDKVLVIGNGLAKITIHDDIVVPRGDGTFGL